MSRTRTISALHNVPLTNLATEQIDFLHFIIHLQNSRYSNYPQILLTSQKKELQGAGMALVKPFAHTG